MVASNDMLLWSDLTEASQKYCPILRFENFMNVYFRGEFIEESGTNTFN